MNFFEGSGKTIKRNKEEKLRKDDIIIAIMGPTGAGKSNIIDRITSQAGKRSGAGLESYTSEVNLVRIKEHPKYGDRIVLVDTPGFDDTNKSDMEILQIISKWLVNIHRSNIFLHGAMFLHRITDKRMDETRCRSLHAFFGICGTKVASNVALVTTMWDDLEILSQGEERERHLRENYWGTMIRRGAFASRFLNTYESAMEILENLLERPGKCIPFRIQEEIIGQKRPLRETQAAKALYLPLSLILTPSTLPPTPPRPAILQRKEKYDEWESINLDAEGRELPQPPVGEVTAGKQRSGLKTKALHIVNIFAGPRKTIEDMFGQTKRDALLQEHRKTSKAIEDLLQRAGGIKGISRPKKTKESGTETEGIKSLFIESVPFVGLGSKLKAPVVYGPPLPEAHSLTSLLFDINMSNTLRVWLAEQHTISLIGVIPFDFISRYKMAARLERRMTYIAFLQTFYDSVKGRVNIYKHVTATPSIGYGSGLSVSVFQPSQVSVLPEAVPILISTAFDIHAANFASSRLVKEKLISLIILVPLDATYRYRVAGVLLNRSLGSLGFTAVLATFLPKAKDDLVRRTLDIKPADEPQHCSNELDKGQFPPNAMPTETAGYMPAVYGQKYSLDLKALITSFCSLFMGNAV